MYTNSKKISSERGYTMVETILYISILGVLGVVLAGYAQRGFNRYRIGRAAQQVIDLKRAVLQYTAVKEDYSSLSLEEMAQTKAIPLDMRDASCYARHALGGTVELGPATAEPHATEGKTENKYMFYLTFNNLSKASCLEILTEGQFYGDGGDIDSLIVNGTYWYYENSFYKTILSKTPDCKITQNRLTVEQAHRACINQENNTITWIFS